MAAITSLHLLVVVFGLMVFYAAEPVVEEWVQRNREERRRSGTRWHLHSRIIPAFMAPITLLALGLGLLLFAPPSAPAPLWEVYTVSAAVLLTVAQLGMRVRRLLRARRPQS
jgi:hypothetical protein